MIENFGIGIDIVDVERFRKIPYEQKTSFYNKIFTKKEIEYCMKFSDPYPHFAGKFAVKEAVKKSINQNLILKDIQTSHYNKKPTVKIINAPFSFKISLSHEKNFAVAVIISEIISIK